jgi:addiction module HigA family antidote
MLKSSIIINRTNQGGLVMTDILPPVHPGEVLREEYLMPLKLSAGALAKRLGVPRTRIERLASEQTGVTPDTALRLGKFFNTTPEFWMNMQASYDLKMLAASLAADLAAIRQYEAA